MPLVQQRAVCGADDSASPPLDPQPELRLRTHAGTLLAKPTWIGAPVPDYVARTSGEAELLILDDADGGHLALYREPYGSGSCAAGGAANCGYEARFYDRRGQVAWALRLGDFLSREEHLEIQDIRLAAGVLYFNEACQSYSSGAGGDCSRLVAVDPRKRRVLWRTEPLVSNGRFRIRGCHVITGYGFTSEPDALFVVDRATGKVHQRLTVSSAPQQMTLAGADRLDVELYAGATRRYRLDGFDGATPKLVDLDPPEMFAGQGYGGAGYGGSSYGNP